MLRKPAAAFRIAGSTDSSWTGVPKTGVPKSPFEPRLICLPILVSMCIYARVCAVCLCLLVLATPAPALATGTGDLDPVHLFERAVDVGAAGDHSLARTYLEPVLLSPRVSRGARARAYYLRGLLFYRDGAYVSAAQDYRRALGFQPTLAQARNGLAWLHLKGLGVDRSVRRAETLYRLAARQGYVDAQYTLGLLLARGDELRRDPAEAIYWFETAAAGGHGEAAALGGRLLVQAAEQTAATRARLLLERAIALDHAGARLTLGKMLLATDPVGARIRLEEAASTGSARAQAELGRLLLLGAKGIDAAPETGVQWLREAAKQGNAHAQTWLGWAFDTGLGTAIDPARARRWYERAARREDATAQFNLSLLYREGRGTPVRPDLARQWLERAAALGQIDARTTLAWRLATAADDNDRDARRALILARAVVAEHETAQTLDVLAAALAASGRYGEARAEQQRALALAKAVEDAGVGRAALEARLAAYREERAWRE